MKNRVIMLTVLALTSFALQSSAAGTPAYKGKLTVRNNQNAGFNSEPFDMNLQAKESDLASLKANNLNQSTRHIMSFDFNEQLKKLSKAKGMRIDFISLIGNNSNDLSIGHNDNHHLSLGDPVSPVPVPAAVWLFGSALLGLLGVKRKTGRLKA